MGALLADLCSAPWQVTDVVDDIVKHGAPGKAFLSVIDWMPLWLKSELRRTGAIGLLQSFTP